MTAISGLQTQPSESSGLLETTSVVVGITAGKRSPAAAVALDGRLHAFLELERLTRTRGAVLPAGEIPKDSLQAVLKLAGSDLESVRAFVIAEDEAVVGPNLPRVRLDHHTGHAATGFLTSTFERAAILVCDQNSNPEISVWLGTGGNLTNQHWPWRGIGFASLFSECADVFGLPPGQEHRLEALARVGDAAQSERIEHLFRYRNGSLLVDFNWKTVLSDWLNEQGRPWSLRHAARVAAAFHRVLGRRMVELVGDIRRVLNVPHLCLAGGVFYNTLLNTQIAESGYFADVYVPPNPGNAGIAAGAALVVGQKTGGDCERPAVSPFLGPDYTPEQIKSILDNCKLAYEYLSESQIITACVDNLLAGRLIGWFQGRMEWGHRALGNRSILANPFSPYVLDNLNTFLKQREQHRGYSLSICEEETPKYFAGPNRSCWMEFDYQIQDLDRFRHVLPLGASTVRLQTVGSEPSLFRLLLRAFGGASGVPALVNTSFNGFSEPIVCSPRDAIRVFFGTGLDVLVLGRFLIRK